MYTVLELIIKGFIFYFILLIFLYGIFYVLVPYLIVKHYVKRDGYFDCRKHMNKWWYSNFEIKEFLRIK